MRLVSAAVSILPIASRPSSHWFRFSLERGDELLHTFLVLMFQCRWYGVMYECMQATHKMSMLYFVTYIFIVTISFASLVVALVFQLYGQIESQRRNGDLFLCLSSRLGMLSEDKMQELVGRMLDADLDAAFTQEPHATKENAVSPEVAPSETQLHLKDDVSPNMSEVVRTKEQTDGKSDEKQIAHQHQMATPSSSASSTSRSPKSIRNASPQDLDSALNI